MDFFHLAPQGVRTMSLTGDLCAKQGSPQLTIPSTAGLDGRTAGRQVGGWRPAHERTLCALVCPKMVQKCARGGPLFEAKFIYAIIRPANPCFHSAGKEKAAC